ncbi:MAG: hypothetical protein AMJ79_08335 [Phycisphaerae bacterium SM23_30]|nr:MAG: hypothetical protein AMJ79_08335 [Phycisphaerae bacterium SM23_30]
MMGFKNILVLLIAALSILSGISCTQIKLGPPTRMLSEQEVVDALVGSSIQATRNSNSARMIETARALLKEGKKFTLISVEDLPDDWMVVAAAGGVGGGGAWEYVRERTGQQNLPTIRNTRLQSAQLLSRYLDKKFDAVIRNEAGQAMLSAFQSAIELGVPVVDACLAGRAKPELNLQVSFIHGISGTPAAMVTRWGDEIIIGKAVDDYRLEDLARAVAVASGGGCSIARNPMTGREVKQGVIRGGVSEAILLGRTVREAKEQGEDPIAALVKVIKGYKLFHGIVTRSDERGERGFSWVDVELKGINEHEGHTYKVFVKNENIIAWLDDQPDVMPPDLIYNLDPKTGDAIRSASLGGYPLGTEVVIVGRAASPIWRTPKGIELFGPRHFGYNLDYVPIEELQTKK